MRLPVFFFIIFLSAIIFSPIPKIFAVDSTNSAKPAGVVQARPNISKMVPYEATGEVKEKIASRAAILKDKLAKFRDKKKALVVERVDMNLEKVNDTRTDLLLRNLNKMSSILERLEERINGVKDKDTTDAKKAVDDAKVAVSDAQTMVNAQQAKEYVIEATAEATIREEVRDTRDELHNDLKTSYNQVVIARKAVANAIETVAKTLGGVK